MWLLCMLACGADDDRSRTQPGGDTPSATSSVSTSDGDSTGSTSVQPHTGDTGTATEPTVVETGDTGTPHTGDTGSPSSARFELVGEPVTCADPSKRDESPFETVLLPGPGALQGFAMQGGGLVVADLDGDPELEIVRLTESSVHLFDLSPDGRWEEHSERLPVLPAQGWMGASAADIDGDDDLDLILGGFDAPKALLRNQGDGTFVDISAGSGLQLVSLRNSAMAWADWNLDGVLDLAVANYGLGPVGPENAQRCELYIGNGDGTFTDVSEDLPETVHAGYTFHFGFFDLDEDQRPDLLAVQDYPWLQQSVLVNNTTEGWVAVEGSGFAAGIDAMGMAAADQNGDGMPDFAISSIGEFGYYESLRTPSEPMGLVYLERALELGLDPEERQFGWGTDFGDVDNDGDEDLYMAFGDWVPITIPSAILDYYPDALWINDGEDVWTDRGVELGVGLTLTARGSAMTDIDGDGWLDIVVANMEGPTAVHRSRCGDAAWLTLELHDETTPNTRGVGAVVDVYVGETQHRRWLHAGSTSLFTGQQPRVHVGLGDADLVDRVEVTWPDGELTSLSNVASRQRYTLHRR